MPAAMQRRLFHNLLKLLGAAAFLLLLAAIPLSLIWYLAAAEHDRRVAVLEQGVVASAIVTDSYSKGRSCRFEYHFSVNGVRYKGGEGGCPLVDSHPVGSSVRIRFNPEDPHNSVAIGAALWPGWAIVPLALGLPILFFGILFMFSAIRDARRQQRTMH
jgi:hypothetical protein